MFVKTEEPETTVNFVYVPQTEAENFGACEDENHQNGGYADEFYNDEIAREDGYASVDEHTTRFAETLEQSNARKAAEKYLVGSVFSRTEMIEDLESEGFSYESAVYAVDSCNFDWNAHAVKRAKSYIDTEPFSRKTLIEMLELDGFTHNEAVYGVDTCNPDWFEQAVKFVSLHSGVTKDEMLELLILEGFTQEQAVYGVNNGF